MRSADTSLESGRTAALRGSKEPATEPAFGGTFPLAVAPSNVHCPTSVASRVRAAAGAGMGAAAGFGVRCSGWHCCPTMGSTQIGNTAV